MSHFPFLSKLECASNLTSKFSRTGAVENLDEVEDIPIRKALLSFFAEIDSPLQVPSWNLGRLICTDAQLKDFVVQKRVESLLDGIIDRKLAFESRWHKSVV